MHSMETNRRTLLAGLSALGLVVVLPKGALAATDRAGFLTTARDKLSGRFLLARVDEDLNIVWEQSLPGRAHGTNLTPDGMAVLVVGRRPGMFAVLFDVETGETIRTLVPVTGRHFYGHGVYSYDGGMLFMTENAYETGDGMIGVYDARDGYKRIGEFSSGGVGPHQLELLEDGRTLTIANGGIRTHPDRGREKLNLDTMRSSLTLIDSESGTIMDDFSLPDADDRLLSLRHLALDGPRVVIVAQDQAKGGRHRQLTYYADTAGGNGLTPLTTPDTAQPHFNGYCGSVATDAATSTVAVSSPRGNTVAIWRSKGTSYGWLGEIALADCCGLGGCMVTTGSGVVRKMDAAGHTVAERSYPFRQWDNHLTPIG